MPDRDPRLRCSRFQFSTFLALASLATIAIAANLVFGSLALHYYRANLSLRLNPTGSESFQRSASMEPTGEPTRPRVLVVGDSRVHQLDHIPDLPGVELVALGRDGETSAQLDLRLENDVLRYDPDLVVLQIGINDLKGIGVFSEERDAIREGLWMNLRGVINRLQAAEVPVLVLTIFPVGPISLLRRPIWSHETFSAIQAINSRIRELRMPGLWTFDCDSVLSRDGRMRSEYVVDDFHMNAEGYAALTRQVSPVIREILSVSMASDD